MTDRLYQRDSYLTTFDALVTAVRPDGVVLDRTAFFPTGGGLVGDTGTLAGPPGAEPVNESGVETGPGSPRARRALGGSGGIESPPMMRVLETVEDEHGDIVHRLERPGLAAGDTVHGELDWARRYLLMRYHTATHVLTGVMFNDFRVRVTGNQLTPDKGRVDFAFEQFDREVLEEGFRRANTVVGQNLPVRISFVPAAEASARPELFKLETAFRHDLPELRLVEIVGFDTQADGGCHVATLGEIGRLVLTKTENKGKANRRVYFVVEA